ncbi:MAG: CCA tRNA nucleotidyltransferase [Sulfurimonas sp.]
MKKIKYPTILDKIFEKLNSFNIKPVIVGGFIRDTLLEIESKDIDIELYNVEDIDLLESILVKFGSLNTVGKSFSVLKLNVEDLELDFSLPRIDSKVAEGHRGFEIKNDASLDFKTATSRRDFTINAIGYDVIEKKFLDPFNGITDLKTKKLKAVDLEKFGEDPLRVLRAVQFAARFDLDVDPQLLEICQTTVKSDQLLHLSRERIFSEIEKLLTKSQTPSQGFLLIKEMGLFKIFQEFFLLSPQEFEDILTLLDRYKKLKNKLSEKESLIVMFTIVISKFSTEDAKQFLHRLSANKEIINKVANLHNYLQEPSYTLAMRIDKALLEAYLKTIKMKNYKDFMKLVEPKIKGKDLIEQGLKPSKEFSVILEEKYKEQLKPFLT